MMMLSARNSRALFIETLPSLQQIGHQPTTNPYKKQPKTLILRLNQALLLANNRGVPLDKPDGN